MIKNIIEINYKMECENSANNSPNCFVIGIQVALVIECNVGIVSIILILFTCYIYIALLTDHKV
jgi:hypothetical protein